MVAEEHFRRTVLIVNGSHHFRCGMVIAMVWVVSRANGEAPTVANLPPPVHSLSPVIRDAVTKKLPKYTPPLANPDKPSPVEESKDSPDILRLPKVTVRAARPTAFPPDFATLTPKQRLDLALKANPGLRLGNILGMNNGIAMAMQNEQRDLEKKAALRDTVNNTRTDDSPESRRIDQLLKAALVRPSTGWTK